MEAYHVMISFWLLQIPLDLSELISPWCLIFLQELPVQKQSDYVQDFYQSFAKYFKGEYISLQVIMYGLSWRYGSVQFWLCSLFQVLLTLRSRK